MNDFQRTLNLIDLIQVEEGTANATMQTHNPFINDCCERQPVKEVVDLVEDRVDICGLFTKSATAFFGETERVVDPFVLVVTSEQVNFIWEFHFQSHK